MKDRPNTSLPAMNPTTLSGSLQRINLAHNGE